MYALKRVGPAGSLPVPGEQGDGEWGGGGVDTARLSLGAETNVEVRLEVTSPFVGKYRKLETF